MIRERLSEVLSEVSNSRAETGVNEGGRPVGGQQEGWGWGRDGPRGARSEMGGVLKVFVTTAEMYKEARKATARAP